jgi:hypothetical protein
MIGNNHFDRIWMVAVVCFKVLSQYHPGDTKQNHGQDSQFPGSDANMSLSTYKSEVLPLEPTCLISVTWVVH